LITTAIGSVPWKTPDSAIEKTWNAVSVPFWPQLPKRRWRELMIPQFAENLPGVLFDDEGKRVLCRYDSGELERFWNSPDEGGAISEEAAAGLHAALKKAQKERPKAFKTHTTGPVTFCLSVTQPDGTPIMGNAALREAAWMLLAQKAIWQVRAFGRFCEKVYHFFDEPALAALGANPALTPQLVREALTFVQTTLKAACPDVISGLHCCGNTDWGLVLSTEPDLLSFDAFNYGQTLLLYPEAVRAHAARGGLFALGAVPTDEAAAKVSLHQIVKVAENLMERLSEKAGQKIEAILTPACGAGSLPEATAERVFSLLQDVAAILRA